MGKLVLCVLFEREFGCIRLQIEDQEVHWIQQIYQLNFLQKHDITPHDFRLAQQMASVFGAGGGSFGGTQTGGGLFGGGAPAQATGPFGGAQTQGAFGGGAQQPSSGGGLFGNPPAFGGGAQSQAPTGGGLFGQPAPQPQAQPGFGAQPQTSTFGSQPQGGQPGGLFGATSQAPQPAGFSQGLQGTGQTGGGLFGGLSSAAHTQPQQQTQGMQAGFGGGFNSLAQTSTSTFTTQQQPGTSAFGQTAGAFGGAGGSGGTGGLFQGAQQTQNPIGGGGLFGAQPQQQAGFQQQKSSFFQPSQGPQTSSFGGFGGAQTQGAGAGASLFGNPAGQQPQQHPALASQSSFGPFGGQQPQQQQQLGMGGAAGQGGGGPIYGQANLYEAQVTTVGFAFQPIMETVQDNKVKDPVPNLAIQNIRGNQKFKFCSNEMLRVIDMLQMKGQQVQSYECAAMNEFNQNKAKYPQHLMQASMQRNATQAQGVAGGQGAFGQQQSTFQRQSTGINLLPSPSFSALGQTQGQQTANPGQTSLFGAPQTGGGAGGLFGAPAAQTQSAFGFPQQQPQQQQPAQASLFGPQGQNPQQPQQQQPGGPGLFGAAQQPGAGGAFQQPAQQPGSLFGPQGQAAKPAGTGLFANPAGAQQPGAGLFGAAGATPGQGAGGTSSLFGPASKPATPQPGLFQQPSQQQPGGLFSGTAQPGGLFSGQGAQMKPQQTPSLFGTQSTQMPMQAPSQMQQTPSLFGPQATPQQPGQTPSLFGPTAGQPTQGSLFGPAAGAQQQTPSLFGPQTATPFGPGQTQQQTPGQPQYATQGAAQFNPMSVYQSQDPFGLSTGFMSRAAESVDAVKKELEVIGFNANKAQEAFEKQLKPTRSIQEVTTTPGYGQSDWTPYGLTPGELQSSNMQLGIALSLQPEYAAQQEDEHQRMKQNLKYGAESERYKNELKAMKLAHEKEYGGRSSHFGYRDLSKRHSSQLSSSIYSTADQKRGALTQVEESFEERRLRMPKVEGVDGGYRVPDLGLVFSRTSSVNTEKSQTSSSVQQQHSQDTVFVQVIFKFEDFPQQELPIRIHKSRDVGDLYGRTQTWLVQTFNLDPVKGGEQFSLWYKNQLLDKKASLKDAGITEETAKVYVQIQDQTESRKEEPASIVAKPSKEQSAPIEIESASKEQVPRDPKPGYQTEPAMSILKTMSAAALQKVANFKISNEHGSVEWIGDTDVSGLDLADLVTIVQSNAEVYDDDRHKMSKPPVGHKLNKPANITLFNIKPRANQSAEKKEQLLRRAIEKGGAEFLSYDSERFVWQFRVQHFTKWGDDDEDDEDNSEIVMDGNNDAGPQQNANSKEESKSAFRVIPKQKQFMAAGFKAPFEQSQQLVAVDSRQPEGSADQDMEPELAFSQQPVMDQSVSKYPGKRQHFESESERESIVIDRANETRLFSAQLDQKDKASRIDNTIRQKELMFKQVNPLLCEKPSDKDTMDYIKKLGLEPSFAKTSLRSGIARPCFSPNGQIAFVSGSKIRIVPTVPVDSQPTKAFSPASTVLSYTQVESKNEREQLLGDQMQRMNLNKEIQAIEAGNQFAQKLLFNDGFFFNLLKKELPQVGFCSKAGIENKQVQLNGFLYSLAKEMAQQAQSEKLKHEFIVVCMLNALFGNPCLNLVQLHPAYKGPKTLQRDWENYGQLELSKTASALEIEKKRLNAVSEVLRFYCPQVHQYRANQQSSDEVYGMALHMLKNGDIKSTVKYLSSKGKNKIAMIVARSVNSRCSMDQLQVYMQTVVGQNGQRQFLELCQHICFSNDKNEAAQLNLPWDQELLKTLLFSRRNSDSLKDIVRGKADLPNFKSTQSILWSLLSFYANIRDSETDFKKFNLELAPACSQRDYRLRWLTQLVLTQVLHFQNDPVNTNNQGGQYAKKGIIEDSYLVATSGQYIRQLLAAKDWRSALTVALLVPATFPAIRAKLLYEVLGLQVSHLLGQSQNVADFVTHDLNLPPQWLKTTIALCMQNFNLNEAAIKAWLAAGNPQQAHRIWHENILPLYMNSSANVSLVKALQHGQQMTQSERAKLIKDQLICQRGPAVDRMVAEFHQKAPLISDWETRTGNFRKFCELLKDLQEKGAMTGEACRSYTSMIRQIQAFSRDDEKDAVDHFIGQEIATIGNLLQVCEDDDNAKDERLHNTGQAHYASHSAKQFKFASDACFVEQNRPRIARQAEQLVVSQLLNRLSLQTASQ